MRIALLLSILAVSMLAGCSATPSAHDVHTLAAAARQPLTLPTAQPGGLARLPLFERLMHAPHSAGEQAGYIDTLFRAHADSPQALTRITTRLAGIALARDASAFAADEARLLATPDPLATALQWLNDSAAPRAGSMDTESASTAATATDSLPVALQHELARLLAATARAERFRRRAFAALPSAATPELLIRQAVEQRLAPFEEPDFRRLPQLVEREALAAGMLALVAGVENFVTWLKAAELPALRWQASTALGTILIDTTGSDGHHELGDTLLLVDTGGNDRYTFRRSTAHRPVSILIDLAGDDHYNSSANASGPAVAVLGYAVSWDGGGNDVYDSAAHSLRQGAALFGAALLVDEAGDDRYRARSHAQGWALGGSALLLDRDGDDDYHALALAQGSAGPQAVAALVDAAGKDRYTLASTPLIQPSSQLPERNLSMGQGAAMGLRADFSDGRALPGGLGILLDFAGDDRYHAQVFAQGAGYYEGTGMLVDGDGNDEFDAAWYAMAAAAHRGAGILLKRGNGKDRYHASHSTSIGAAHDRSIAFFIDEGGDDHYTLGDLGLGGAHDNSTALFIDAGGDDHYTVTAPRCLAFGAAHLAEWGHPGESQPNVGLFFDLGGNDDYTAACAGPANDTLWHWPRQHPALDLPSERGAGFDGESPTPFANTPLTR